MDIVFPFLIDGHLKDVTVRGYHINPMYENAVVELEWDDEWGHKVRHNVPIDAADVATEFPIAAIQANLTAAADAALDERFKITNEQIVFDMFNLGELTDIGDPSTYTITTTRASVAKNIWTKANLAVNEPCRRQVTLGGTGLKVWEYASFGEYTRINDADLTNWIKTGGATVLAGAQLDYDYVLTLAAGDTVFEDRVLTLGLKHHIGCWVRKISGDASGLTLKIVDVSAGTAWATIDLSVITSEWDFYGIPSSAVSDTDGRFIFTAGAGVVLEVQYMQVTSGLATTAHPFPFMPGAGAGVVHALDDVRSNVVTNALNRSIIHAPTLYRHLIKDTLTSFPKTMYAGSSLVGHGTTASGGGWQPTICNVQSPLIPGAAANNERLVLSADWDQPSDECLHYRNGAYHNTRVGLGIFNYASLTFGGLMPLGGNRPLNGSIILLNGNIRFTPAQHSALSQCTGAGTIDSYRA